MDSRMREETGLVNRNRIEQFSAGNVSRRMEEIYEGVV